MSTITWVGSTSGAWDTDANWLGGAKPSAADDVVFDRGAQSITTGPASAIALASLKVRPTYSGSFSVVVTLDTITLLDVAGSGGIYNVSAPVTTCRAYLSKGVTLIASGGTWTNSYISGTNGGKLYVNGATLTNRYCTNIAVEDSSGGSASTIVQLSGGSGRFAKNPGTLTTDGVCGIVVTGTAAVTAATIGKGGVYNHQSSGTISALTLRPGSEHPGIGSYSNYTISQLNLWPNAYINRNPPGATVTISAETSFGYQGGSSPIGDGP